MDRRRAYALALVAVLISTALVAAPAAVRAAPAPSGPAAPHPGATVFISAVSAGGCGGFSPGLQCGHVYFSAYDPSDNSATVTIHDQNYTRDDINATAATWTVSFTASVYNDSQTWGASYFLPLNLSLGGWWNISIHGTLGGVYNASFFVTTYYVDIQTTQGAYLARHSGTALYYVQKEVNSAPMSPLTSLTLTGQYYTNTGTWVNFPGLPRALGTASTGSFNFTVPSDASTYGYIDFDLFANLSAGTYPNSNVGFVAVALGSVSSPSVNLETCLATSCSNSVFANGTPVYVATQTWILSPSGDFPAVGLTAAFQFDAGVNPATPLGQWPSSVTTNATGGAAILFLATSSVFAPGLTDSVKVSVTDPLNSGQTYGPTVADFTVLASAPSYASLQLRLDSAQYFGGDTATAKWQLGGFSASAAQGWTIDAWQAWENDAGTVIAEGPVNSTATSGQFTVVAPVDYSGQLEVDVWGHNATGSLYAYATAEVTAPTILLNPSEVSYLPGDTVTVAITTEGQVFANATLYASVADNLGNIYQNGPIAGSSIGINVPQVGTPTSVRISLAAQDSKLGIVATAALVLDEASGLAVSAGVSTASNYADGSFQPGQTISLHYSFHAYGNAVLAKSYAVSVFPYSGFFGGAGEILTQTTSTSGDVSYTIPSGTPAGAQLFEVIVSGSACSGACYGVSLFSVNVQPNPSALQYNLGAGSGLTVGWLVLFLIIVIVAILLVMMIRRKDRPKVMKPLTPSSSGSSSGGAGSPPPGASGSGGSSSWQETSSGSAGGNPPLPTPPK